MKHNIYLSQNGDSCPSANSTQTHRSKGQEDSYELWDLMGLVGRFHKEVCLASGKLQTVNTSAIAVRVHLAEPRLSKKRVFQKSLL